VNSKLFRTKYAASVCAEQVGYHDIRGALPVEFPNQSAANEPRSARNQNSAVVHLGFADNHHRHFDLVPYGIDGGAKDQVLDAAVPVRRHHEKVGR